MLDLKTKLTLDAETIKSPNLCDRFDLEDLQKIGRFVKDGYDRDMQSRATWKKRNEAGMELALQVVKAKNFPWPNCSNIAFPLITVAALQFHARAYPALVSGPLVVKARVNGPDPQGLLRSKADRISTHMSWQVLEDDQSWEEQHDRLLINVPIVGTAFKKTYYSAREGRNKSELVLAQHLVLNYYAKSVEDCACKTHWIPLYRNEIYERVRRGMYRDVLEEEWYKGTPPPPDDPTKVAVDKRQGTTEPQADQYTDFGVLEQHINLDLDGDGYAEPYIITVEEKSASTLRIVTRFEEQDIERDNAGRIVSIRSIEYFTKYPFIPSPDGGIYDIGFGVFLGPLNESVNSIINQLVDAGTMANTAGGFLGRGVKIRGGQYTFSPLEWKRVDSTGDDLRKNIVPLEVRQPSDVLLKLLSLLIDFVGRITNATEATVGENPGQNTPASTQQSMVEQGQKIYSGIFKRIWRSMKQEFKKLYILNARFLPEIDSEFGQAGGKISRQDYLGNPDEIAPAADPYLTSDSQAVGQAMGVAQRAQGVAGYNRDAVERNLLRAMKVQDIDALFPGSDKVPPIPNPIVQREQIKAQTANAKVQAHMQEVVLKMQQESAQIKAKITLMEAQAAKLLAEASTVQSAQELKRFESELGALKAMDESMRSYIDLIQKGMSDAGDSRGGVQGMAPGARDKGGEAMAGAAPAVAPGGVG